MTKQSLTEKRLHGSTAGVNALDKKLKDVGGANSGISQNLAMLTSQSLQTTQNVSRAARIQMNQKIGGQSVFGIAGGTQQIAVNGGNFPATAQFQNQKYKNIAEMSAGQSAGQTAGGAGILSNQRSHNVQTGGGLPSQDMRALPSEKSKLGMGQAGPMQMPQFLQDSNQIIRKSRQQQTEIVKSIHSSDQSQPTRGALGTDSRQQRIVYINATGHVQEVPKEILSEISLIQNRHSQVQPLTHKSGPGIFNRQVKAISLQPAHGNLGSGVLPLGGPGNGRLQAMPNVIGDNETAANSKFNPVMRNQISLNNTKDNSVYSDGNSGAVIPLQIESGLGVLTRPTPGKAQTRVGHTSTMRQQFAQKQSEVEKQHRNLPQSVLGQVDSANRAERQMADATAMNMSQQQQNFGLVSLSTQNNQILNGMQESDNSALMKKLNLPDKSAKSSDNTIDRTIIPQIGKNEMIMRQMKNADALNHEQFHQQPQRSPLINRQSPGLRPTAFLHQDQLQMKSNERKVGDVLMQKQVTTNDGIDLSGSLTQSQRRRLGEVNAKNYSEIENERYARSDPINKHYGQGIMFSNSILRGGLVSNQNYIEKQYLGTSENTLGSNGLTFEQPNQNIRSVDNDGSQQIRDRNSAYLKGTSMTNANGRGGQRTPRTPASPDISNDLLIRKQTKQDGSRSPSNLEKRRPFNEGQGLDLRLILQSNDEFNLQKTKNSIGQLQISQNGPVQSNLQNGRLDLLPTGLQARTFKAQKKSHQEQAMSEAFNEAYYGNYGTKPNPGIIDRKHSNHQLAFAQQDKMQFAQAVERQYIENFIASSPKQSKHPMQVLSPSEGSNASHQKLDDSPQIKEDNTFDKSAPNYISEDTAGLLTITRGGQQKDLTADSGFNQMLSYNNQPANKVTSNPTIGNKTSISIPFSDNLSLTQQSKQILSGNTVKQANTTNIKTITSGSTGMAAQDVGKGLVNQQLPSQKSLRQQSQDYMSHNSMGHGIFQQYKPKERKKSSKAIQNRQNQNQNFNIGNGQQASVNIGRHLNFVNGKQVVGGATGVSGVGTMTSGKRHSSMKQKQLSIRSIGLKVEERKGTTADASINANKGRQYGGREPKRSQTQKPTQQNSQMIANQGQPGASNQAMFINHGNININININGGNQTQSVTMNDGKQEVVQQVRGLSREQIQRLNKMSKEELSQIICSNFLLQPDGTLFQKADNFGGQMRSDNQNGQANFQDNGQTAFICLNPMEDPSSAIKSNAIKYQRNYDGENNASMFKSQNIEQQSSSSPDKRSLVNQSVITNNEGQADNKLSGNDYGNSNINTTHQSVNNTSNQIQKTYAFGADNQAQPTVQGPAYSLTSPESPRSNQEKLQHSPNTNLSNSGPGKQRVNLISGVIAATQMSGNKNSQFQQPMKPQMQFQQQIQGQLSSPPRQSLIAQRQQANTLANVLLNPPVIQQQNMQGLTSQQTGKINSSLSKTQLKKQVVQFYWQNLIQSYGVESKHGFKLDVKGKTINNNQGSVAGQNQNQQQMMTQFSTGAGGASPQKQAQGGGNAQGGGQGSASHASHYQYLSQQAHMVKQQLMSQDQSLKNSQITVPANFQVLTSQQRGIGGQPTSAFSNSSSPIKALPPQYGLVMNNNNNQMALCKCDPTQKNGTASGNTSNANPTIANTRLGKPHDSQASQRSCSHQNVQSLIGSQLNSKQENRERNQSQNFFSQNQQAPYEPISHGKMTANHQNESNQNATNDDSNQNSPSKVCKCCGAATTQSNNMQQATTASITAALQQTPLTKAQIEFIIEKGGLKNMDAAQLTELMQIPMKQAAAEGNYIQLYQTNQNASGESGGSQLIGSNGMPLNLQNYHSHNVSMPQGQQYALQRWLVSQYQIQQQQNQQTQEQIGRDGRQIASHHEPQTQMTMATMDPRARIPMATMPQPANIKSQYTIFDYHNQEGGYLHLFDQFGQHSHFCKCFKTPAQREQQKTNNARIFVDPYQRLNYIQQVCLQERYAAQAHQAALHQAALQKREQNVLSHAGQQNLSPKSKRKPAPISRMDQINLFIRKLNQLINITLKATDSINPIALNQIKKLGQEIGIKWQSYLDAKFIKSKDFVTFLKSKIYVLLNNLLMKNNVTLFSQVQLISAACILKNGPGNSDKDKDRDNASNDMIHPPGLLVKQDGGLVVDRKLLLQTNIGQVMINNQQWMNQIQVYNILKFKNSGFKYWVEWPNAYCNNFIVVKNVCKRRTWLSWVDHDPYEERTEPVEPPKNPINDIFAKIHSESQQKKHEKEKEEKEKQEKEKHEKEKEQQAHEKSNKKNSSTRGSSKKKGKNKSEAAKAAPPPPPPPADPSDGQSNDSGDETNDINYPVPANCKILPNVIFTQVRRIKIVKELLHHQIYNHIDGINQIAAKCQLHRNMAAYAMKVLQEPPSSIMPETYIVDLPEKMKGSYILEHDEFKAFQNAFKKDSWWIVKPGEEANRGHGIKVLNNLQKIKECLLYEFNNGPKQYKTCILQRYIENPFLVHRRKFDIRVFALLSYFANFEKQEGVLRGWYYEEGYIRTSSKEFCLANGDNQFVHLTNDAVQKQSQDYGKFEAGNKLSYSDFDKICLREKEVSFYQSILPQIKNRVGDTFKAAGSKLIGEVRSDYNGFEWLGFDFMLDDDLNLSLIEVNTNPCLETQSCILLQRLIPQMLDQSLKIAVDPFFGASENQYQMNQEFVATEIKYSMVYEETIKNIRSTPFWDDNYLTQSPYLEKMKQEIKEDDSPAKAEENKPAAEGDAANNAAEKDPVPISATNPVSETTLVASQKDKNE